MKLFHTISTMNSPTHEPKSPTKDEKTEGSIDFDNLMEKQRELLKHIRSSPDKKKDKLSLDATPPTAPNGQEWGYSFERIPTSRNSSAAYDGAAGASLPQKKATTKKQKRQQAEEWISDWHYERVTSEAKQAPAPAFNGNDSESTSQWYFERIPSSKPAGAHHHEDVMEMDDFAALEAAVVDVNPDDISLEDLVADVDEDDVIMSVEDDEGLLPSHEAAPGYMNELKHRQYSAAYMNELKHRQAANTDEDGDAQMGGEEAMTTPDSSAHTPTTSHHSPPTPNKPTRSPSCVMESLDSSMSSKGFPRPQNLVHSKSESYKHSMPLPCAEGMDGLFKNTLDKLTKSMARSAETRRSLKIKTHHTQEYERNLCVHQILQSVENSSRQVDSCLQWYRPSDGPAPTAVTSGKKRVSSS